RGSTRQISYPDVREGSLRVLEGIDDAAAVVGQPRVGVRASAHDFLEAMSFAVEPDEARGEVARARLVHEDAVLRDGERGDSSDRIEPDLLRDGSGLPCQSALL